MVDGLPCQECYGYGIIHCCDGLCDTAPAKWIEAAELRWNAPEEIRLFSMSNQGDAES